jgi:glucokinase
VVIDIGASRTRLALARDGALMQRVERRTTDLIDPAHRERGIVDQVAALARTVASSAGETLPGVVGVSVAAAVGLDGSVLQPREFGVPGGGLLREALEDALHLPVAVDNDANCAAFAEQQLGSASGCRWVAVLTLGTNIGLGLILDGTLVRGSRGAAGEAGLLLIPAVRDAGTDASGRSIADAGRFGRVRSAAPFGYAWIEELIGGGALREAAGEGRRVLTAEAYHEESLRPLADRAVEGWAFIIADLMALLDLEVVVLTGGLAVDAAHLLDPLRGRVAELVAHAPDIRLGSLGPDAELIGADLIARAGLPTGSSAQARAGLSAQPTGGRR